MSESEDETEKDQVDTVSARRARTRTGGRALVFSDPTSMSFAAWQALVNITTDELQTHVDEALGMLSEAEKRALEPITEKTRSTVIGDVVKLINEFRQLVTKTTTTVQDACATTDDGVPLWDEALASLLAQHGKAGNDTAAVVRAKGKRRAAEGQWFALHLPANGPRLGSLLTLAYVAWREASEKTHRPNTRMPTTAIDTWSRARAEGATVMPNSGRLRVHPPKGYTLLLPWDGERPIGDGKVSVLSLLDGQATRVWVAMWALWTRQGCPDHGEFHYSAEEVLEDIFGGKLTSRGEGRNKNLPAKSVQSLNDTIRLLSQIGVTEAGDYEQLRPEALVNVRRRKSTREATLVHAGIVVKAVRDSYVQLPQNICRVDYRAVPLALGVGRLIRPKASEIDLAAPRVALTMRNVLEAAGEDVEASVRKHGAREHWRRAGERVVETIEQAGFGQAILPGAQCHGADDSVTVELAPKFAEGYRPLIESRAAHLAAKSADIAKTKRARAKAGK
jgi:hypothetical protein